jgi:hypothetical protein
MKLILNDISTRNREEMNKPFSFLAKIGGKEAAIEIKPMNIPAD